MSFVTSIARFIDTHMCSKAPVGLYAGLCGQLMFLNCAERLGLYKSIDPEVLNAFNKVQDNIFSNIDLSFGEGLYGRAWFIEYINQSDISDYDETLLNEIDIFTHKLLLNGWQDSLELIYGLAGIGIYVARRGLKTDQSELIDVIVKIYQEKAIFLTVEQCTWPLIEEPKGYNLGFAHGITGVLATLLSLNQCTQSSIHIKPLILAGCNFLLSQQRELNEASLFPHNTNSNGTSRLGWCYGDIIIALTLARAGTQFGITSYIDKARQIALHAAQRDSDSAFIDDGAICHGAIGIALIFYLINKIIPDVSFERAVTDWLEVLMNQLSENSVESLVQCDHQLDELGLLTGLSGIGLGLISILENDTSWLDCLNLVDFEIYSD